MEAQNTAHRLVAVLRDVEVNIDQVVFTGDIFRTTEQQGRFNLPQVGEWTKTGPNRGLIRIVAIRWSG